MNSKNLALKRYRLLIFCLCLQALPLLAEDSLHLAADDWPPFTGRASERRIAEDLVTVALRKSGHPVRVSLVPWDKALAGAESGQFDGLVAAWSTPARRKTLLFSKVILQNRIHAISLRERGFDIRTLADLRGKTVGKVAGYAYGESLDNIPVARTVLSGDDREAVSRLLAREVDLVLIDDLSLRYLLEELPVAQRSKIHAHAQLAVLDLHFTLSRKRPDAATLMSAFNQAIREMMSDGTYNELLGLSWLLVDADGVQEFVAGSHGLDLTVPPDESSYAPVQPEKSYDFSTRTIYRVGGRQYDNWEDAKGAIIDDSQTRPTNRMIQENRYEIGVPL